jgi:hypothetical protein
LLLGPALLCTELLEPGRFPASIATGILRS